MARIAVITALYNHEKFVEQAIESVLAQTYKDWELILWDDSSKDAGLSIAHRYEAAHPGKIRVFTHEGGANRGQEATRNAALKKTDAEFFALLDSDDCYHPGKLENLLPLLEKKTVGMAYGETIHLNQKSGKGSPSGARFTGAQGKVFPLLLRENFIGAASVLVRRSALPSEEPFDSHYKTCGEYPLWLAIAKDWEIAYHPAAAAYWRVHGANTSLKLALQAKRELVQLFETLERDRGYAAYRALLKREVLQRLYDYGAEAYSAGDFHVASDVLGKLAMDLKAPRSLRWKAGLLAAMLKLGPAANQAISGAKKKFWEIKRDIRVRRRL